MVKFPYEVQIKHSEPDKHLPMKALFNNNLINTPLPIMPDNRAFQFGDGIFETIWFRNGTVPLIEQHRERLRRSAEILRMEISEVELKYLVENIGTLRDLNLPDEDEVVAKLMIWRHASGRPGYWADETSTDSLLVVRPYREAPSALSIDFCEDIRIARYPWSTSKNLNALPYVLASIECRQKSKDELILLNERGELAEGIASNIFILTEGSWKTPELDSGCVAGTMRAFILAQASSWGINIHESFLNPEDLQSAEGMLMTRSTGISVVQKIADKSIETRSSEKLRAMILESLK